MAWQSPSRIKLGQNRVQVRKRDRKMSQAFQIGSFPSNASDTYRIHSV